MELLNTKVRLVKACADGYRVFGKIGSVLEVKDGKLVDAGGFTWNNNGALFKNFKEFQEFFLSNDVYNAYFKEVKDNGKVNIFKKSDFKDGMIVEISDTNGNSDRFLLLNGCLIGSSLIGGKILFDYNDDLKCNILYNNNTYTNTYSIDKVYKSVNKPYSVSVMFSDTFLELVWEREPKRKMTLAEIEKELGYEIEIERESDRKVMKEDDYF